MDKVKILMKNSENVVFHDSVKGIDETRDFITIKCSNGDIHMYNIDSIESLHGYEHLKRKE